MAAVQIIVVATFKFCIMKFSLLMFLSPNNIRGDWVQISQSLPKSLHSLDTETVTAPALLFETFGTVATTENILANVSQILSTNQRSNLKKIREDEVNVESGFSPYVRNIQNILLRTSHSTVKSKVNLLTNLRDDLLYTIKEKMPTLWQPNAENRQARDYHEKEEYHMDFPSNEGALMTIGFLTFAVFLIKLVLKLVHALKNKQNGNGTPPAVMPTAIGRKKRDVSVDEATKILQLIDEFKFK